MKHQVVGIWELVSFKTSMPDGREHVWGTMKGLLVYTETGRMAVQIMDASRPAFQSDDVRAGKPEEMSSAFKGYMAYYGRYEIDQDAGIMVHLLDGCLFPNWVGGQQRRELSLRGDVLELRDTSTLGGVSVLVWKRIQ